MRGKRAGVLPLGLPVRIIPAHAGQTICRFCSLLSVPDHPRACGANMASKGKIDFQTGSSPRMRGKLGADAGSTELDRIIPAHAGQTCSRGAKARPTPDHPRACGANQYVDLISCLGHGSSPRMRGKLFCFLTSSILVRIIPAHAGQTVRFYAKTLERWTLNNWIRTVAPIFVLLFLPPVIGQNAYIERHYSNQSFSWFSKLHYASAFDLSLVA